MNKYIGINLIFWKKQMLTKHIHFTKGKPQRENRTDFEQARRLNQDF